VSLPTERSHLSAYRCTLYSLSIASRALLDGQGEKNFLSLVSDFEWLTGKALQAYFTDWAAIQSPTQDLENSY